MKTYDEFLKDNEKYDGHDKCVVNWCFKPGRYDGGNGHEYCPMCEAHAGMKLKYKLYCDKNKEEK